MSRHREVRNMNYDEYDDGYDDDHGGSPFGASPNVGTSPDSARYLYNGQGRWNNGQGDEEGDDNDHKEGEEQGEGDVEDEDQKLATCVRHIMDIVGDQFPRDVVEQYAWDNYYDVEKSVTMLYQRTDLAPAPTQKVPAKKSASVAIPTKKAANAPAKSSPLAIPANNSKKPAAAAKKPAAKQGAGRGVTVAVKDPAMSNAERDMAALGFGGAAAGPPGLGPPGLGPPGLGSRRTDDDEGVLAMPAPLPQRPVSGGDSGDDEQPKSAGATSPRGQAGGGSAKKNKLAREIDAEIAAARAGAAGDKTALSLVCVGHVDAGKSTMLGHLLVQMGEVSKKQMHRYTQDATAMGKGSFAFAWVLDAHEEERARGVTMDVAVNNFETEHKRITLLDAPGHRDFIPNMISGAAQADVAILVVSVSPGEFEAGFDASGQTKEHAILLRSLGIAQLIVAVNKLDTVGWSQAVFEDIQGKMTGFLRQTNFKEFAFVPVSGLTGENLRKREAADLTSWYTGPTLEEAIDGLQPAQRSIDQALRLCVSDVYKSVTGGGMVVAGKIEAGVLRQGDKVFAHPLNQPFSVKSIEHRGATVRYGLAGDNVDVVLNNLDELNAYSSVKFLVPPEAPMPFTSRFRAQIVVLNVAIPVTQGAQVTLYHQSASEPATVTKLIALLEKGEVKKKHPRRLAKNETAEVEITTLRPLCLELYSNYKSLGRFMLRDGGLTIAVGIITKLCKP